MERKVIILMERDGRDVYCHGAVAAPVDISDASFSDVKLAAAEVMRRAMAAVGDEWNYDHVLNAFRAAGWLQLASDQLWENDIY